MEADLFHWGGNLRPDSAAYCDRIEDEKLPEHLAAGDFVTVIGPRQMGKTSLLYRVRHKLAPQGYAIAYVDLSAAREEPLPSWYRYIATTIHEQIGGPSEMPATHLEFLNYLRALGGALGRVVLMLDEVGSVPEEFTDAFFGNVRYVFSNRQVKPEFARMSFVLCGTFSPRDLIKNQANSPFNVSKTLRMTDLTRDGVRKLVTLLERLGIATAEDVPDEIYRWTEGQPYLTQRLCSVLAGWRIPVGGPEVVARAVREIMSDCNNLDHVVHRLESEPELRPWLDRVLVGEKIKFNRMTNPRLARLELIGLIKADKDGNCRIRNAMYKELVGAPESVSAPVSEGRECTAVCLDVVDSTRLKQNQDKVNVTYTFQQYHEYVGNLVRRHKGHVKDAAGDGTMAVFDSAQDAVECCREIQLHLGAFNRRHNRLEMGLEVRIGVNSGKVLTRDLGDASQTRNLYDYTLDVAGKVQKGAGAREICLTENTLGRLPVRPVVAREEYWPEYDVKIFVVDPFEGSTNAS